MALTLNADGSATYSITVPAPITVTQDAASAFYTAEGAQVALGLDRVPGWKQRIAGQIAIYDRMLADAAATKTAARDALAAALYAGDVPGGFWSGLGSGLQEEYLTKAESLGALGVSAAGA